jgi:hypothetical protein
MGILAKILGADDVIKRGIKLIDSLHTSKEEEIQAKNEAKIRLLEAYHPYKVAQRYLALLFTAVFLFCFVLVLSMTLAGRGNTEQVFTVLNEFYIGPIVLTIIGFYFSGGMLEGIFRAKK